MKIVSNSQASKGDGLPENVCVPCINELDRACAFRKKCEQTDITLRACLVKKSMDGVNESMIVNEEQDRKDIMIFTEDLPILAPISNAVVLGKQKYGHPEDQILQCSICSTEFDSNTQLKQHLLDSHAAIHCKEEIIDEPSPNSDDGCDIHEDTSFMNDDDWDIKNEGQDEEQLNFTSKKLPTGRRNSRHFGQGAFQCDICHKFYEEKKHLFKHILERHAAPTEYCCSVCKLIVPDREQVTEHMKSQHPTAKHAIQHARRKRFNCAHCEQSFTHKLKRDEHQR